MPQTNTKPAAAKAEPIEAHQSEQLTARERRRAAAKRHFEMMQEFIGTLNAIEFEALCVFKLILSRDRGCITPIEQFIVHVVNRYGWADDKGEGLTIQDIEHELQELRDADLEEAIKHAHFMASRYPRPEPKKEE